MDKIKSKDKFCARSIRRSPSKEGNIIHGHWHIKCIDKQGQVKWADDIYNLVVNAGLNYLLSSALAGGSQTTTWYIGLTNASPSPSANDTMSSHAGWTENTNYLESVRQTWTPGAVASQSVDNTGSVAEFSINVGSQTIGGSFLVSDNTKSGSSGTLYAIGAFSGGDKSVDNGDTLQVTATFTSSDDGS